MKLEDKINLLFKLCKAEVIIRYNPHNSSYDDVEYYLRYVEDIEDDVLQKMIDKNIIIYIQFYPDTPVGFYSVYHYDLDKALDQCIDILREDGKLNNQPPE